MLLSEIIGKLLFVLSTFACQTVSGKMMIWKLYHQDDENSNRSNYELIQIVPTEGLPLLKAFL